ncbi:helix-turn-helix domain-containing protein [Actinomadura gamaensis]|uniref:Helix-turn-helix domain-containing protein n=1 Tax=Actinomadura gamaensis TaxID=1763541 RepID=A0ABV9TYX0_9ACTN
MAYEQRKAYRRRKIGDALRQFREERGLTQGEAALLVDRSASSLSAFENGYQSIRPRDLLYILDEYGVTDAAERARLLSLARQGRQYGWWHTFEQRLEPGVLDFASLESDALRIRIFAPSWVHGLFQSEDYARQIITHSGVALRSTRDVETEIEFRLGRQRDLLRPGRSVRVEAIIGETALRQMSGAPQLKRAQLERLLADGGLPGFGLRVLPFSAGFHPGVEGPFTILDVGPEPMFQVVTVHSLTRSWYIDDEPELNHYGEVFDRIREVALSESDSRAMIEQIRSET